MSNMIGAAMAMELEHDAKATRKLFENLDDAQWDFKPHEKSMALGQLASHVVETIQWADPTINLDVLEMNDEYKPALYANKAEVIAEWDKAVARALELLPATSDEAMMKPWALKGANGEVFFEMPRGATLRGFVLSHMVHHRAQLGVYARMTGSLLPATFGPSADEQVAPVS